MDVIASGCNRVWSTRVGVLSAITCKSLTGVVLGVVI